MKELSPLEKLDAVLMALEKHHSEKHHDLISVQQILDIENPQVKWGETSFILKKLVRDNYIDARDVKIPNTESYNTYYMINFDGRILNQSGGYYRKFTKEKSLLRRIRLQNILLAFGAVVAGIYYLKEIVMFLIRLLFPSCSTF